MSQKPNHARKPSRKEIEKIANARITVLAYLLGCLWSEDNKVIQLRTEKAFGIMFDDYEIQAVKDAAQKIFKEIKEKRKEHGGLE